MIKPYYEDERSGIVLYCGDSREILPQIGRVDAVVTDCPYGVSLGQVGLGQYGAELKTPYHQFEDTEENIRDIIVPAVTQALAVAERGLVCTGNRNAWLYPRPDDIGVWYNPAGTSRGKWGFILAHVLLYYGLDPNRGMRATASSVWGLCDSVKDIRSQGHPCPKPLAFTRWMVAKASLEGEAVLDPFCGSGTTLLAAKQLGRKAIGIELSEEYCEIAVKRLAQEYMQFDDPAPSRPVQESLALV